MKFTFWWNWMKWPIKFSRCILYCVWAFFQNCPWHLSSRFLLCCNILHDERILDIFVSIIGWSREGNAKEVGTGSICVDYIVYFREILTYILRPNISDSIELHFIFYGNILWMLWKHSRLNRWGRQLTQSKKNVNFYCNQFKRCPPHTCTYIPTSNSNNQRKIWTISVCILI